MATLIGSLPVANADDALKIITDYTPLIPLWPQLPTNPKEGMLNQFIEGVPGIVETEERTYFDLGFPEFENDLLHFYEACFACQEDSSQLINSPFAVSKERAVGIYALKEHLQDKKITAVKGQVTGPFTMLTALSDKDHSLGYYNPQFREMLVKGLAMKGAWQVEFLKELEVPVIVFIDEPALAGMGSSAFISIAQEDVAQDIQEVISGIRGAGGLAGVHVCANTDWNFLTDTGLDILSFDAYSYFDKLITCKERVQRFIREGGTIAWGIVPTASEEIIFKESPEGLAALWERKAAMLEAPDLDRATILRQALITPSCGTGALSLKAAMRVMELTREVSRMVRER